MIRGFALGLALVALAGCAGVESAGRSSRDAGALPPPVERASEPAPVAVAPTPAPAPAPAAPPVAEAPVAAPEVSVATPAPPPPRSDNDDVIVRGEAAQVPPPEGDFRSRAQRNEDIRAWDRCVTSVQAAFERDPMRPQLDSPEEYCSRSLGMANRDAIPDSRTQRRR